MICKFCSTEIDEGLKFCPTCGKALEEVPQTPEVVAEADESVEEAVQVPTTPEVAAPADAPENTANESKVKISIVSLLQVLCGLVFVIVGVISVTNSDVSISSASFGADFYTYCYRGIKNCAELLSDINVSLGLIISAFGLSFVFNGLKGLKK